MRRVLIRGGAALLLLVIFPLAGGLYIVYGDRLLGNEEPRYYYGSSGQAPAADAHPEAIVQVYAARAARWRGIFGVHTWVAYKPAGASYYQRTEVIGWGARGGQRVVYRREGIPDGYWYGFEPELLGEIRGAEAEQAIARIERFVDEYPYANRYQVWPGPNSNTYTAHLLRAVDELDVDLPATAIGKDYIDRAGFSGTPSGTGFQFLVHGVFGVTLALDEGIELNLLGATYGVDLYPPALKLPCIGRLGF